jgi:hypothetical protein
MKRLAAACAALTLLIPAAAGGHGSFRCAHTTVWLSPGAMYEKYSGHYNSGGSHYNVYATVKISTQGVHYVVDHHTRLCYS